MSKRLGFWPHITHVIVLTFKEIKHLSDYRTVGLSDRRTVGLSDCRIIGRTPFIQYFVKAMTSETETVVHRIQLLILL